MQMPLLEKDTVVLEKADDSVACERIFYKCPEEEAKWVATCTLCGIFFPMGVVCEEAFRIADMFMVADGAQCTACGGSKKKLLDLFSILPI